MSSDQAARSSAAAGQSLPHRAGSSASVSSASRSARLTSASNTAAPSSSAPSFPRTTSTSSSLNVAAASAARSRHSLYGADDRVVLDLGSRVWKVGFSGEASPRAVFDVTNDQDEQRSNEARGLWSPDCCKQNNASLERKIKKWLRRAYYDELMAEPRTRKVIILESPLLPLRIKDIVAKILFQHLGVPSVTFTLSPLCALLSLGRITGLVVDVGFIESIALPIYASRPLFSHLRATPLASQYLSDHLRGLLHRFALYIPHQRPSQSRTSTTSTEPASRSRMKRIETVNPVPYELLTASLVEEIKTRVCYVEPELRVAHTVSPSATRLRLNSDAYDGLLPQEQQASNVITSSTSTSTDPSLAHLEAVHTQYLQDRLYEKYHPAVQGSSSNETAPSSASPSIRSRKSISQATDLTFRIDSGTITVPGWVRHACTDIFFDPPHLSHTANYSSHTSPDPDLPTLPEVILDTILKLPVDLRRVMISEILVTGGGSMLPGFPIRLVNAIHVLLHSDKRYTPLKGLSGSLRVLNGGGRASVQDDTRNNEDEAQDGSLDFVWERSLLPWVGASLIGALKVGGKDEWTKESYGGSDGLVSSGDWSRNQC